MSNIGLMEGAFFVGRKEILDWINSTLDVNLAKIEDTASGAVACQLLDIMHPGQVPMHKINWAAKQDFEFVANYKILQTAFNKLGIEKHVEVDRLITARYMDNLEFMQWFKRFYEMHVQDRGDYDPYAQRCKGKGGATYSNGGKKPASTGLKSATTTRVKTAPATTTVTSHKTTTSTAAVSTNQENATPSHVNTQPHRAASNVSNTVKEVAPASSNSQQVQQLSSDLEHSQKEVNNLAAALDESRRTYDDLQADYKGLEKERDFYFDKLREIEILLQEREDRGEGTEVSAKIFQILYATAEGFEALPEDAAPAVQDLDDVEIHGSQQILVEAGGVGNIPEETY